MGLVENILKSRASLVEDSKISMKKVSEGGCGVIGVASSTQIKGSHLLNALIQMKNRGNGKGGGVAILGLSAEELGISQSMLDDDYIIQIAFLEASCKTQLEREFIIPFFDIHSEGWVDTMEDFQKIGLEVAPPRVYRYFCRVNEKILIDFKDKHGLNGSDQDIEDEFVYQNSYALNKKYYASLGEKKAFVLSHGKNMLVFKIVGYGHQVIQYYQLLNVSGHIWIGHHRYPTKGTVWHPGGAHPFIGLHEVLVHNGDFSNYHSVSEYLAQRNIYPLFLTDTEVAVYLFDLWDRIYKYPLEYVLEALAPTMERDFLMLDEDRKQIYRELQTTHIHGSPDGPWFFIVGRSKPQTRNIELIGITDTSMLRPQVFALQQNEEEIGLIASERQAIDALLRSLAETDSRFAAKADIYWNARGGSHTDGGAFVYTIHQLTDGKMKLICTDKFGRPIDARKPKISVGNFPSFLSQMFQNHVLENPTELDQHQTLSDFCTNLCNQIRGSEERIQNSIHILTSLLDSLHISPFGRDGRARDSIETTISKIFREIPRIDNDSNQSWTRIGWKSRTWLRRPSSHETALILDASEFPAEGDESAAQYIVKAYKMGWKHVYTFDWRGQRFCGCGLGPNSHGFRLDVYGNPGDYLGSGLDGAEIYVHTSAQDQVCNIMKAGKVVIYGDVGQTFMYGAKGGETYVLGNAAGRPLINAVGKPRVIINGTSLDYLAESFMAGDPLKGGGFVVLNGIKFNGLGELESLDTPYPGSNLFSLASGGAIYVRDPKDKVETNQLNGGQLSTIQEADLNLLLPFLEENEKLFQIPVSLTTVKEDPLKVLMKDYKKVEPIRLSVLS
ncbi:MAG: hypothetical protein ACFFFG_16805 [Candidatus Thorarchaeota archaeon]